MSQRNKTLIGLSLACILLLLAGSVMAETPGPVRPLSLISAGGGTASGGNVALRASLGQITISSSTGGGQMLHPGFWQSRIYHLRLPVVTR